MVYYSKGRPININLMVYLLFKRKTQTLVSVCSMILEEYHSITMLIGTDSNCIILFLWQRIRKKIQ
jgi:hypothetical protein